MILDNNEDNESDKADTKAKDTEDTSSTDSRYIKRDTSLYNALTTVELTLGLAKTTNAPGLEEWFDLEEDSYISLLALELRSYE